MTHSIKFIKSLEKISDDRPTTSGEYTNECCTCYKMWTRFDQDKTSAARQPTEMEAKLLRDLLHRHPQVVPHSFADPTSRNLSTGIPDSLK